VYTFGLSWFRFLLGPWRSRPAKGAGLAQRGSLWHLVNTHLFRDCVATTIAYDDPAHIRVCARVLGHSRFSTTEGHDNVAKTVSAADHYHDLIEAIRSPRPQVRARL
jgi:hypothetical protein